MHTEIKDNKEQKQCSFVTLRSYLGAYIRYIKAKFPTLFIWSEIFLLYLGETSAFVPLL